MNPAAPPMRDLAMRLLAEERDSVTGPNGSAALLVCGKLGALLSKLAGAAGYRSLVSRSLALAQAYAPALRDVRISPEGTLEGLAEAKATITTEEFTRGEIALVVELLSLLHTFIGEPLTLQLVKEAWPAVTLDLPSDSPTP